MMKQKKPRDEPLQRTVADYKTTIEISGRRLTMLSLILERLEGISKNEAIEPIIKQLKKLWTTSKYFRITSIITASFTAAYFTNRIYLKMYRKYYNMPPGMYGLPIIHQMLVFGKPFNLLSLGPNQRAVSLKLGPKTHVISINDPYLMKQVYAKPGTTDNPADFFPGGNVDIFAFQNGKHWLNRRKIIYANLMSTMKAKFVETATKKFIKNKVFTVFDEKISKNEKIAVKKLLRPLGFNIILQACFGQELKSLNDPFWVKFNEILEELGRNGVIQGIIQMLCAGKNRVSDFFERLIGLRTLDEIWNGLAAATEEFAMNKENDIQREEKDENVKLFRDYIDEYTSSSGGKYGKRQLFGDMTAMFMAATDTTYSALGFALLLAAKNPSIQKELFNELNVAFGGNIEDITLSDGAITKIPKLRAFIHEVLRIYPPAILAGLREVTHDGLQMDTGDKVYDLPKGVIFWMNTMMLHHTPKYWVKGYDENNKAHREIDMKQIHFDFWLDAEGKFNRNSLSFLTFSRGKRDCVGQSLAMKELYIVLAMVIMKYEVFGPNGDDQFDINVDQAVVMEPNPDEITLKVR